MRIKSKAEPCKKKFKKTTGISVTEPKAKESFKYLCAIRKIPFDLKTSENARDLHFSPESNPGSSSKPDKPSPECKDEYKICEDYKSSCSNRVIAKNCAKTCGTCGKSPQTTPAPKPSEDLKKHEEIQRIR